MKGKQDMAYTVILSTLLGYFFCFSDALTCLDCKNVAQPYDCSIVTECGQHEICYTEKEITNDGNIYYHVGCRDQSICEAGVFGKRQSRSSNTLCFKCCGSDICNMYSMCESKDPPLSPGQTLCFGCSPGRPTAYQCNLILLCSEDQSCFIKNTSNIFGETRWETGCAEKKQCNALGSLSQGCIEMCCSNNLCNKHCTNFTTQTTPETTNLIPVTSQHISNAVEQTTPGLHITSHQPQNIEKVNTTSCDPRWRKTGGSGVFRHLGSQTCGQTIYDCTFDAGTTCSWSRYTHSNEVILQTTNYLNTETQDHTTGHGEFLYTKMVWTTRYGHATLLSPLFRPHHEYCFGLWYAMSNPDQLKIIIMDLTDSIKSTKLINGDDSNGWKLFNTTLNKPFWFYVILEAHVRYDAGPVAIDDIKVLEGIC